MVRPAANRDNARELKRRPSIFRALTGVRGDITLVHPAARSLYNLEAILAQPIRVTLLAELVMLEIQGETRRG
jgi:hypothetical protein